MKRFRQFFSRNLESLVLSLVLCMLVAGIFAMYSDSASHARAKAMRLIGETFIAEQVEVKDKASGRVLFAKFHSRDGATLSFTLNEGAPGFDELSRVESKQTIRFCERDAWLGWRARLYRTGYVQVCRT